jgi:hypothetical protein
LTVDVKLTADNTTGVKTLLPTKIMVANRTVDGYLVSTQDLYSKTLAGDLLIQVTA